MKTKKRKMISFLLGLVLGLVGGFIGGLFFYARKIHKRLTNEEVTRETINSLIQEKPQQGDFINVNQVQEYVKNHEGEIKLGDVLEDEDR